MNFTLTPEHLLASIVTIVLMYIAWTLRRFVNVQDRQSKSLSVIVKSLLILITIHNTNHPDSRVETSELMKIQDSE